MRYAVEINNGRETYRLFSRHYTDALYEYNAACEKRGNKSVSLWINDNRMKFFERIDA